MPHPRRDPAARPGDAVFVEAPARLHFGMLDLRGSLGRRFGGIGAAIPVPSLLLEAASAESLRADGPSSDRALEFARRFSEYHGLERGAHLRVHAAIPSHSGLGSGTALALAVARAMAELYGIPADPPALARAVGRAKRSAVGTYAFAEGGFVVEGGRWPESDDPAPRLARFAIPERWRCVVAIPSGTSGVSGDAEVSAFARLPPPPERSAMRVSHLVLMALLPALVDGDLCAFGRALTEVQCINGRWFAPVQGGAFAPGVGTGLVAKMTEWGAAGVGQSSWGPAVFGIVDGDPAAEELAGRVRAEMGKGGGVVHATSFANSGARVWRDAPSAGKAR